MVKWKTAGYDDKIERVECTRETESSVWVLEETWRKTKVENRRSKVSRYDRYHDTWEAAHAHILQIAENNLNSARLNLQRAQGRYGQIKGMRKPDGAEA